MTRPHVAFFLALAFLSTSAFGAAVTVDTQSRSIRVAIPSIDGVTPDLDETVTAPDANPFNETLDRTLSQLEQTNHALASQTSSWSESADNIFTVLALGETRYNATGVEGIVLAESNFSVTFTLAEERDYAISGTASFPDTGAGASDFAVTLTGPGGTIHSFTKADFNPNLNDGTQITPTFDESGTLAAGQYTLAADSGVSGGTNLNEILANFDVTFTASAGGEPPPPPPPPNAIPLPAAVWPGIIMLSGLGAAAMRKRMSVA
jgi:hypothetical protein